MSAARDAAGAAHDGRAARDGGAAQDAAGGGAGRDVGAARDAQTAREAREAARRTPSGAPHRRLPPLLPARVRRALVGLLIVVAVAALYLFVLTRGAVL